MNDFSETWCDLFLTAIPPEQTLPEIAFIQRHMPLPSFARVLDIACGAGRHSCELSTTGYSVVGIDSAPERVAALFAPLCTPHQRLAGVTVISADVNP